MFVKESFVHGERDRGLIHWVSEFTPIIGDRLVIPMTVMEMEDNGDVIIKVLSNVLNRLIEVNTKVYYRIFFFLIRDPPFFINVLSSILFLFFPYDPRLLVTPMTKPSPNFNPLMSFFPLFPPHLHSSDTYWSPNHHQISIFVCA